MILYVIVLRKKILKSSFVAVFVLRQGVPVLSGEDCSVWDSCQCLEYSEITLRKGRVGC